MYGKQGWKTRVKWKHVPTDHKGFANRWILHLWFAFLDGSIHSFSCSYHHMPACAACVSWHPTNGTMGHCLHSGGVTYCYMYIVIKVYWFSSISTASGEWSSLAKILSTRIMWTIVQRIRTQYCIVMHILSEVVQCVLTTNKWLDVFPHALWHSHTSWLLNMHTELTGLVHTNTHVCLSILCMVVDKLFSLGMLTHPKQLCAVGYVLYPSHRNSKHSLTCLWPCCGVNTTIIVVGMTWGLSYLHIRITWLITRSKGYKMRCRNPAINSM